MSRATGHLVVQLLLLGLCALSSGCTIVGAVMYKVAGPPPVDALYIPPPEPMLVFVERYRGGAGATEAASSLDLSQESESLARELQRELEARAVAPQVDPMSIASLRMKDPVKFHSMNVSQIGDGAGASQVLYVNILSSSMQIGQGSPLVRGKMQGRVKVIDVKSGTIVWPPDTNEGYPVSVQTALKSLREGETPVTARNALIRQMADAVTKLFYKHVPDEEFAE